MDLEKLAIISPKKQSPHLLSDAGGAVLSLFPKPGEQPSIRRSLSDNKNDEAVWQDGWPRVGYLLCWGRPMTEHSRNDVDFAGHWIQGERAGAGLSGQGL